jgi:hypothetical protein
VVAEDVRRVTRPRIKAAVAVFIVAALVRAALGVGGRGGGDRPVKAPEQFELLSTEATAPVPMVANSRG